VQYQMIQTSGQLTETLDRIGGSPCLVVDTEFVRTRTYHAQLGLLQLYDGHSLALVDPLAVGDLAPLWASILDRPLVIHAAGEDLELIAHLSGRMPTTLYDSQIAAAFLGYPLSTGYGTLIQDYLGIILDKSEARADWLARPLTGRQLEYAARDVFYLYPVFERLRAQLQERGWWQAFTEECAALLESRGRPVEPASAYLDIKNAWRLRPRQLALLQLLAKWRLELAIERDMAVNFVVKGDALWQIARHFPKSLAQLHELGLRSMEIRHHGKDLLEMVAQAEQLEEAQLPGRIDRLIDHQGYKAAVRYVRDRVEQAHTETGLPVELIASKKLVHEYLHWCWRLDERDRALAGTPRLLTGWRHGLLRLEPV